MKQYREAVDTLESFLKNEIKFQKFDINEKLDTKKDIRPFELRIRDTAIRMDSYENVCIDLLTSIGYMTSKTNTKDSVPYRLFSECFMKHRETLWKIDNLTKYLDTSKPTVYRHLNKLEAVGVVEGYILGNGYPAKKGYRLRYGNLSLAWFFVEENVNTAMKNYRLTIEYLQDLIKSK
jgi:DNA-binding transcriptional ArsR family regulator